ncbi:CBASS cGAMP-activated phospholipase [Aurantimonas sp. E1-2-R+4]|uniref:CBASS cGAMP-activated phospholipase n=1 Tax=Aurantimonas sp. E1-2-R+4 TaxID=3113714 RepID=UPI002F94EA83
MPFQILSLSGGGYMGLYTASVLARLEEQTEKPIAASFDLIAGTSVGGIIALGLSAGRTAVEIERAFVEDGDKIFPSSRPVTGWLRSWTRIVQGMPRSRYDPAPLRAIVDRLMQATPKMSDLKIPVLVTAVNLTKGKPRVFKTGHHPNYMLDWRLDVADVALATSAAPTYFPIHKIESELFADGGMYANSPDLIALHEAEHFLGRSRPEIRVLSIGTTTAAFALNAGMDRDLGSLGWMQDQRLPTVMIGSQQAMTDAMMRHLLGDGYIRIDHEQSPEQRKELALDCASPCAKENLQAAAASSAMESLRLSALGDMLRHRAPPFEFVNASLSKRGAALA